MPVYSRQSQLFKRNGAFAALFISFVLAGCSVDVETISGCAGDSVLTKGGAVVGHAAVSEG